MLKLPANHSPNPSGSLIVMRDIFKTFNTGAAPFTALKSISLEIRKHEFVAIIGKSGSGKSTLLNLIAGIDRPTSGQIFIDNTPVHALAERELTLWRGRTVGIIFQFFQLLPTLTVLENVLLPMDFCNRFKMRERRRRALELLELVELTDQAHKLPATLSGGQQQRVAIARALANDPPIVTADEPTGNLDSKMANIIFGLFERLVKEGKTVLVVTHDRDLAGRVQRCIELTDGEVVETFRPDGQPQRSALGESSHDRHQLAQGPA